MDRNGTQLRVGDWVIINGDATDRAKVVCFRGTAIEVLTKWDGGWELEPKDVLLWSREDAAEVA